MLMLSKDTAKQFFQKIKIKIKPSHIISLAAF